MIEMRQSVTLVSLQFERKPRRIDAFCSRISYMGENLAWLLKMTAILFPKSAASVSNGMC